ncbi:MAG: hypothetical protein IKO32_06095 [Lachnospiraceae bacterium]|nr:hypothetical protein [Lachnospiraceae bacterium]
MSSEEHKWQNAVITMAFEDMGHTDLLDMLVENDESLTVADLIEIGFDEEEIISFQRLFRNTAERIPESATTEASEDCYTKVAKLIVSYYVDEYGSETAKEEYFSQYLDSDDLAAIGYDNEEEYEDEDYESDEN